MLRPFFERSKMEKTISLNGKDHKFRITAATTFLYRQYFNKDLLREFQKISKTKKGEIPDSAMETMAEVAFIAAKQADKDVANDLLEWMDQFDIMDFYQMVIPAVFELWQSTNKTTVFPKK